LQRIKLKSGPAFVSVDPAVFVAVTRRADGSGWKWACACGTTDEGPFTGDLFAELGAEQHCQWHVNGEDPDWRPWPRS